MSGSWGCVPGGGGGGGRLQGGGPGVACLLEVVQGAGKRGPGGGGEGAARLGVRGALHTYTVSATCLLSDMQLNSLCPRVCAMSLYVGSLQLHLMLH